MIKVDHENDNIENYSVIMDDDSIFQGGNMVINHNISAIFAHRTLKFHEWSLNHDIEKLSSGMRINRAGDDASGLAVSEKMRTQINGLRQAERNTEDGMSFIQTAEGYLTELHDIIQRVRVLAVQSANGIYTPEDRQLIQVESCSLQFLHRLPCPLGIVVDNHHCILLEHGPQPRHRCCKLHSRGRRRAGGKA